MNSKNDIRAGYRVPDGYFEDFSVRMAVMAASTKPRRRSVLKPLIFAVSAAAAMVAVVFGIFGTHTESIDDIIASAPSDVVVTQYFGATESDVVDYFLTDQSNSESISDEDVLEYLSTSGMVNLYALMDY